MADNYDITASTADLLSAYGMRKGEKKRTKGESTEDFFYRVIAELPEVLVRAQGNIGVSAAIFDEADWLIKDLCKAYDNVDEARREGLNIAAVEAKNDKDLAREVRKEALRRLKEEDSGVRRSKWPKDDGVRFKELLKILPRAIQDYYGDESMISTQLSLPMHEIVEAIGSDEDLIAAQEAAMIAGVAKVESHLFHLSTTSKSPTAAMFYLKNVAPKKWSDKQTVEVKSGFEVPTESEASSSVLSVIQGSKPSGEE